jgi:hypothetical protein
MGSTATLAAALTQATTAFREEEREVANDRNGMIAVSCSGSASILVGMMERVELSS